MRVLVTRPQPQADDWVRGLRAAGLEAEALPLIEIGAPEDDAPVLQAWQRLAAKTLAMFVSPNAVGRFFAARPSGAVWPPQVLAGSTGPGTTAALLAAGVPKAQIMEPGPEAARFDSEALWQRLEKLRNWRGARVMVVRGEGGRDWLAQTLGAAGAQVDFVEAYRRLPPRWDEAQKALLQRALAQPQDHAWLFSSSEAIGQLQAAAPGADWSASCACASHPRIAAKAREAGFAIVLETPPAMGAVVAALASASQGKG